MCASRIQRGRLQCILIWFVLSSMPQNEMKRYYGIEVDMNREERLWRRRQLCRERRDRGTEEEREETE